MPAVQIAITWLWENNSSGEESQFWYLLTIKDPLDHATGMETVNTYPTYSIH